MLTIACYHTACLANGLHQRLKTKLAFKKIGLGGFEPRKIKKKTRTKKNRSRCIRATKNSKKTSHLKKIRWIRAEFDPPVKVLGLHVFAERDMYDLKVFLTDDVTIDSSSKKPNGDYNNYYNNIIVMIMIVMVAMMTETVSRYNDNIIILITKITLIIIKTVMITTKQ